MAKFCSTLLTLGLALLIAGCNRLSPQPDSSQGASSDASTPPQTNALADSQQTNPASPRTIPGPQSPIDNDVGISAPQVADDEEAPAAGQIPAEFAQRTFAVIEPVESEQPAELFAFLKRIDAAISDLVVLGSNNQVEQAVFVEQGLRLGSMKLDAGEQLANSPEASPAERKTGVLTQLVALSHMSGLGDVQAAQKLEDLARGLIDSGDPELAHEGHIVLLGFDLQALQNGLKEQPDELLAHVEGLFQRPEDRNFPEFMTLQQAYSVLNRMGFREEGEQIKQVIIKQYQDVADAQLRGEAWAFAVGDSQAWANFHQAQQSLLGTGEGSAQDLLAAARGLFEAYPSAQTLEQLAKFVANMEYAGFVAASDQLASFLEQQRQQLPESPAKQIASQLLDDHAARLGLIGQQLALDKLVDFEGHPIDWSQYDGKVVLIDFWATWCMPCLREMPNLRQVRQLFSEDEFAIVAINMDESPSEAGDFIRNQRFPWTNYHFQDPVGFRSEFATQHGLNMIPFLVLRNRDGTVAAVHVRGNQLEPRIRALLDPAASPATN